MSAIQGFFVCSRGSCQYAGDVVMQRHRDAEPGYWLVTLLPTPTVANFFDMMGNCPAVPAVVDDFGNLVRVQ